MKAGGVRLPHCPPDNQSEVQALLGQDQDVRVCNGFLLNLLDKRERSMMSTFDFLEYKPYARRGFFDLRLFWSKESA